MSMSRAELYALSLKAGRAAGVPFSQAQELARLLAASSTEAVSEISEELIAALNCVRSAAKLDGDKVISDDVLQSIPAALDLAHSGARVRHAPSGLLTLWAGFRGISVDSEGALAAGRPTQPHTGHIALDAALRKELDRLAFMTYVPSSAESQAGAGAGDIDND